MWRGFFTRWEGTDVALLEVLFGVPAERFIAEHWLRRPLHATGPVDRLADHEAWFSTLIGELALGFTSPPADVQRSVHPAGASASKRFDRRELVIAVLAGSQRWRVARNETVPQPLAPNVAGTALHSLDRAIATGPVSVAMPVDAETFVLEPGSVLYIPRGAWYDTHALTETALVVLAFKLPTWIEMVINTAMVELGRDEEWRELSTDDEDERFGRAMQRSIEALRALRPPRG
jgi:ribosomal protein L16 Arg81 hydroxylase